MSGKKKATPSSTVSSTSKGGGGEAGGSSRYDCSLGLLTKKFVSLVQQVVCLIDYVD
jgi:hypothetical protein